MTKKRITITLSPALLEQVDELAEANDASRSETIERLILMGLGNGQWWNRVPDYHVVYAVSDTGLVGVDAEN